MEFAAALLPYLLPAAQVALAVLASAHVVLHKRDVRAAIGWIGLAWLVPFGGPALYWLFGINRIHRRATGLRRRRPEGDGVAADAAAPRMLEDTALAGHHHLQAIGALIDRLTETPLTAGNTVAPLPDGRAAYRAMLTAIDGARASIALATYIFDSDRVGRLFIAALARAAGRGVRVRVLVDAVGVFYTRPPITRLLAAQGVSVAEFLPPRFPFASPYAHLRNHRKILIVDGTIGFIGGMNIRAGHLATSGAQAIADCQFRLTGPVVGHLTETFADDWSFATGARPVDDLAAASPAVEPTPLGNVFARGIAGGPDETFERVRWAMLAALAVAHRRVRIVTPYFLPEPTLMTALMVAAMRGVRVDIVLPADGNLRLVQWASRAKLAQLLARGCFVWLTPPPFDHSKLMTVDDAWVLLGSANWDPRSLRLNFEFNVECYSEGLAAAVDGMIDARLARAIAYRLADDRARRLLTRLRDGTAWLLSPYL